MRFLLYKASFCCYNKLPEYEGGKTRPYNNQLCYHQNIPFLKMLDTLHHNQRSVVLDNQPLQLLLNYDKINETNYTQTLRLYFAENCNVTRTAKRLYIHRHTLLNRLDKIRELSNLNLEDYYARIYMSIALLFHDYFAF